MNGVIIRDKRQGKQLMSDLGFLNVVKIDTKRDGVMIASTDEMPSQRDVRNFDMQVDENEFATTFYQHDPITYQIQEIDNQGEITQDPNLANFITQDDQQLERIVQEAKLYRDSLMQQIQIQLQQQEVHRIFNQPSSLQLLKGNNRSIHGERMNHAQKHYIALKNKSKINRLVMNQYPTGQGGSFILQKVAHQHELTSDKASSNSSSILVPHGQDSSMVYSNSYMTRPLQNVAPMRQRDTSNIVLISKQLGEFTLMQGSQGEQAPYRQSTFKDYLNSVDNIAVQQKAEQSNSQSVPKNRGSLVEHHASRQITNFFEQVSESSQIKKMKSRQRPPARSSSIDNILSNEYQNKTVFVLKRKQKAQISQQQEPQPKQIKVNLKQQMSQVDLIEQTDVREEQQQEEAEVPAKKFTKQRLFKNPSLIRLVRKSLDKYIQNAQQLQIQDTRPSKLEDLQQSFIVSAIKDQRIQSTEEPQVAIQQQTQSSLSKVLTNYKRFRSFNKLQLERILETIDGLKHQRLPPRENLIDSYQIQNQNVEPIKHKHIQRKRARANHQKQVEFGTQYGQQDLSVSPSLPQVKYISEDLQEESFIRSMSQLSAAPAISRTRTESFTQQVLNNSYQVLQPQTFLPSLNGQLQIVNEVKPSLVAKSQHQSKIKLHNSRPRNINALVTPMLQRNSSTIIQSNNDILYNAGASREFQMHDPDQHLIKIQRYEHNPKKGHVRQSVVAEYVTQNHKKLQLYNKSKVSKGYHLHSKSLSVYNSMLNRQDSSDGDSQKSDGSYIRMPKQC